MKPVEPGHELPIDPDVDLEIPAQRRELHWSTLAAVSAGGVLGALARYGIGHAWPTPAGGFPWATFLINVTGCLLIGALMVLVTDVFTTHRLLRPFLGVGVLGGYTTFSTYSVEIRNLIVAGAPGTAALYLLATLAAALVAVFAGMTATRFAARRAAT
ncbi:MAG TPA: CrcB family protein [Asanoa sp.]|nr:CrcB family protein [Asanoa sp.]